MGMLEQMSEGASDDTAGKSQHMKSRWLANVEDLYQRHPQPRTLEEDIMAHRWTGYVFDREEYFLMGRPVRSDAPVHDLQNPWRAFPWWERPDCWMIWAYSGPIDCMLSAAPYWLPWVCWSRRNGRIRIYSTEAALAAVSRLDEKMLTYAHT